MKHCVVWLILVLLVGCSALASQAAGIDPDDLTVDDFAFMPHANKSFVEAYRVFLKARAGDQNESTAVPTYGQAARAFARAATETHDPYMRLRCAWFTAFCRFLDMDFPGAVEAAATVSSAAEVIRHRGVGELLQMLRKVDDERLEQPIALVPVLQQVKRTGQEPSLEDMVMGQLSAILQRNVQTRDAREKLTTYELRTRLFGLGTPREQERCILMLARLFREMSVNVTENREKLNQALCVANMRHLGVCINLYAQDNGGFFPESYDYAARLIWQFRVLPYTNSPSWNERGDIWQCPSCSPRVYCYGINQNISIRSASFPAAGSRERINKAAETVLLADSVHYLPGNYPQKPDYNGAAYNISWDKEHMGTGTTDWNRHSGGANILFVDGRVEWRSAISNLEWTGR